MRCSSCAAENRDTARFCDNCGSPLSLTCARCGAAMRPGAQFCDSCGQPVSEAVGPSSEPPPTAATPRSLPASFGRGRYQVLKFLGEGGRKRVFLAHDTRLDRDVAVALIKTEGLDATGLARVRNEAQAMARLGDHANVVTVFDSFEESSQPVLVAQYMAGGSVEDLLEKADGHRLPLEDTLRIAGQVCHALEHAHARGVVHRDIKPGNVWLTEDSVAKLGDFGLAAALDRSRVTMAGMMLGTVAYMPPEQALGGDPTPSADLYSLGCMLYEMVAGRPPFVGDDPTAVISQHINQPPVAPSWLSDICPPDLEELILRLLAKSPEARPASAAEVAALLAHIDPAARSASHSGESENPLDRLARGVFVGRAPELEKLRRAFDEAFAGHGSLVMLVGEPGIGKTRTCQELETHAKMRGAQVLWGTAHEGGGAPPYWPWYRVGTQYAGANDLATTITPHLPPGAFGELSRIFTWLRQQPGFAAPAIIEDPEAAQFQLFEAYASFLRAIANQGPTLIVLDDLHWADKPSLLLLQHVAHDLSRQRVLAVGNYRDTDVTRQSALSETLAALNRDPGFERIVLRGLSRNEVADYIRVQANVEPKREVVDRIFEETEGNPFFLSEVVNLMAQEGTLTKESLSDIRVPDGVREALGRRLNRLSEEANELLQVAAIIGREFPYEMLTLLGDREEEALLKLIEETLRARVIEEMGQLRYRFTHAQMQETLLEELSTTRRVRLHGQVGEALEKRWGEEVARERAPRLARHFVEAALLTPRHAEKAVLYSKLAAEQAEAQTAWEEAARHYENCLTLVTTDDSSGKGSTEDEAALLTALGRCQTNAAVFRDAWRSLMRAIAIYRQRGDWAGGAGATLIARRIPQPNDRLLKILTDALDAPGERDPRAEARLYAIRAAAPTGVNPQADQDFERASAIAEAHGLTDVKAELLQNAAHAAAARERNVDEGARLRRADFQRLDALGRAAEAAQILLNLGEFLLIPYGRLDDAKAILQEALAYARRHHIRYVEDGAPALLAAVALARCEFQAFDELLGSEDSRPNWLRANLRAMRAEVAGDLPRASAMLPDISLAGGLENWMVIVHGLRARVLWRAGDIEAARFEFSRLREVLDDPRIPMVDGVRINGPSLHQVDEALPFLADEAFMKAAATVALEAPVSQNKFNYRANTSIPGAFARVLLHQGHVEKAEEYFRIALEWCERERCPVEAGRCLQGLAGVAARRNERAEALNLLDRAAKLFQEHGARLYLDQVLAKRVELEGIVKA